METLQEYFPGSYRDSVALMQLSAKLAALPGVSSASAQMATAANLDLMLGVGLLTSAPAPRPNDLLLLVRTETAEQAQAALEFAKAALADKKTGAEGEARREPPRSIGMALAEAPASNLALISTPGEFAGAEALKALRQGLNVMMFSDNVPVAQEVELKTYAREHGLLVMGPDCGTAIVGGVPLAFANVVARGAIGVVGASGTGIQQVTTLVDRLGEGVSHALGTGGHDLSLDVGGLSMLTGLEWLAADEGTRVIVLLSKPPAEAVAQKLLTAARSVPKKVVVCFLGAQARPDEGNLVYARTLEQAAFLAVGLLAPAKATSLEGRVARDRERLDALKATLRPEGKLRALYTGGTFCYEAQLLLQPVLGEVWSNTPTKGVQKLPDLWTSRGHTILDLGDDDFTRGKPHPMIDPSTRNERLLKEAADPATAVVLLDLVLGYGSHEDPAAALAGAVAKARDAAVRAGRTLAFVGFVCGTNKDPQDFARQTTTLRDAGVLLAESNAHAAEIVAYLMGPGGKR